MPASMWEILGLSATIDEKVIRRAYAARLKVTNPEENPEGFKILRAAYENAMRYVGQQALAAAPRGKVTSSTPAPAQPSPPPAVDALMQAMAQQRNLCVVLETLISAPEPPAPAALVQALTEVLQSPAFQLMEIQTQTEIWLLRLIAKHIPRSDPLLAPAKTAFGWRISAAGGQAVQLINLAMQRAKDLTVRACLAERGHLHHEGFTVLACPFKPLTLLQRLLHPTLPGDIRRFLRFVREDHSTLIHDLDKACVAAWELELSRPRLSPWALWVLLAAVPCSAWFVFARDSVQAGNAPLFDLLLGPAAISVAILLYQYAFLWPRARWNVRFANAAPLWLQWGWVPGCLTLLLAAVLLPPDRIVICTITVTSVALGLALAIIGKPDPRLRYKNGPLSMLFNFVPLLVWWGIAGQALPMLKYAEMTPPVIATLCGMTLAISPLLEIWFRWRRGTKLAGLLALSAGAVAAAILAWFAKDDNALLPISLAMTTGIVLLQAVPAVSVTRQVRRIKYYAAVCGFGPVIIGSVSGPQMQQWIMALLILGNAMMTVAVLSLPLLRAQVPDHSRSLKIPSA